MILALEDKVKQEDMDVDVGGGRVMLKDKEMEDGDLEKGKWKKLIANHKLCVLGSLFLFSVNTRVKAGRNHAKSPQNITRPQCPCGYLRQKCGERAV